MKSFRLLVPVVCLAAAFAFAVPPKETAPAPDAAVVKSLSEQTDQLDKKIGILRRLGITDPYLAEVEIYHKAAAWLLDQEKIDQKSVADATREVLNRGLLRAAQQARGEAPWLYQTGQSVTRAYRSRIDGSIQPYAVSFPADYGKDRLRKWRVDVVLHGRNDALTEVSFLHQHDSLHNIPADQDWVQIDIFGRGNNAYRWAGETDMQEAVENFLAVEQLLGRAALIDHNRFVLRGFSMGGAGTWHLGLHRPATWCVIGPGAGFTTSHGYRNVPDKLPSYQEACLSIYDAVDYAENAFDVPVVAYAGADDPQLQAAKNIEEKLKGLNIPMTLLVAPGLKHQFPAEWQKKAEAEYQKFTANGRPEQRPHIHFVTYTLKYPACDWVEILALGRHYQRALVDAQRSDKGLTVKTENVRILHLGTPPGALREATPISIDGQNLKVTPYQTATGDLQFFLERRDGQWSSAQPERLFTERLRTPEKTTNLQGPIDDAFMSSFLCVRGSGKPWNDAVRQYVGADIDRFQSEWTTYFRGDLPVKDDVDVTPEDLVSRNLILFGDPGSNSVLAQAMPGLPFRWAKDKIAWNGKDYAAAEHVPVLIYPSPFAANRYVVLNSGHTFHAEDFKGTNALLYPRLGDYALLKTAADKKDPLAVEVVEAGLFDDFWRWPARP
jgi:dienelactone hydrolase